MSDPGSLPWEVGMPGPMSLLRGYVQGVGIPEGYTGGRYTRGVGMPHPSPPTTGWKAGSMHLLECFFV